MPNEKAERDIIIEMARAIRNGSRKYWVCLNCGSTQPHDTRSCQFDPMNEDQMPHA